MYGHQAYMAHQNKIESAHNSKKNAKIKKQKLSSSSTFVTGNGRTEGVDHLHNTEEEISDFDDSSSDEEYERQRKIRSDDSEEDCRHDPDASFDWGNSYDSESENEEYTEDPTYQSVEGEEEEEADTEHDDSEEDWAHLFSLEREQQDIQHKSFAKVAGWYKQFGVPMYEETYQLVDEQYMRDFDNAGEGDDSSYSE